MRKELRNIVFLSWIIVFVGCTNFQTTQVGQPTTSVQQTATSPPTVKVYLTSRPIEFPTRTLTLTYTPKPESTNIPISSTLTPPPTLSNAEFKKLVTELLLHNADCQYPCWWGIVPGETTWSQAYHFLESFVEVMPPPESSTNSNGEWSEYLTYSVKYPLMNKRGKGGFTVTVKNDQISIIFVGVDLTKQNSLLHQVLTNYGSPDKIYLQTFKKAPSDDIPLILVLYYASKNFILSYEMIAHSENDKVMSCPHGESPALWLWSPDEIVTEQRIQDWTLGVDPIIPLKPLEQVTDLDVKSFTEIFNTTNISNCLSTNKNFWNVEP